MTPSAATPVRELVERHILVGRSSSLFTRECEQIVRELGQALGVGFEVGDERRRRTVAREVGDVAAQRGQWSAQLV